MRVIHLYLLLVASICWPACYSQSVSYYDLTIESDSIVKPFVSTSANFAFVRSKRGVDGVNQTPEADAIRNGTIQKIILVFSEDSPEDIENREEYNMERWDNLILTYPEFFQEKTKYKNICQCVAEAGSESFKQAQGFYIYFKTDEKPVVKEEKKAEPEKKTVEPEKKSSTEKVAEVAIPAVVIATGAEAAKVSKSEEKPAKSVETKEETTSREPEKKSVADDPELEPVEKPVAKTSTSAKKPVSNKPRRAKDPKACRPAFYGSGDEDIDAFFRDNFVLDKKQKKKAKKVEAEIRLQLNVDGSIKRVMVICENEEFKSMFEQTVKAMNNWNAAVRGGVTVRSEVRMKLRFDKESKSFKKFELINNPKPGPKCKQQSDEELFGS